MASSGIGVSQVRRRQQSPEWHEASGADLARPRFAELAHHRDVDVRETLARREDCPMAVLATLAHDARAVVRVAVAANPAARPAILEHLAKDRDTAVAKAVARNRAAPATLRQELCGHRKGEVRRAALRAVAEHGQMNPTGDLTARTDVPAELRDATQPHEERAADKPMRRSEPRTYAPRPVVAARPRPGLARP